MPRIAKAKTSRQSYDALPQAVRPVLESLEGRRLLSQTPFGGAAPVLDAGIVRIEAEDFDEGGQGVAFNDSDPDFNRGLGNGRPAYRQTGVDVATNDVRGLVGWTRPGEWLEYTVSVPAGGASYDVSFSAATSNDASSIRLEHVGGTAVVTGAVSAAGWSTYQTHEAGRLSLPAGEQVLRVTFENAANRDPLNLDWVEFAKVGSDGADLQSKINAAVDHAIEKVWLIGRDTDGSSTDFVDYVRPDGTWVTVDEDHWAAGYTPGQFFELAQLAERRGQTGIVADLYGSTDEIAEGVLYSFPATEDVGHRVLPSMVPYLEAVQAGKMAGDAEYIQLKIDSDADARNFVYNDTVGAYPTTWRASSSGNPDANFGVLLDQLYDVVLVQQRVNSAASGGETDYANMLEDRVRSHGRLVAEHLVREDGSTYQWGYFNRDNGEFVSGETYQGLNNESTWARGQAWAILSFAELAKAASVQGTAAYDPTFAGEMAAAARKVANYFIDNLPSDFVPYWDFDAAPGASTPRDTSAAAIASYGLQVLGEISGAGGAVGAAYTDAAENILASLIDNYLTPTGDQAGILDGGSGNVPAGVAVDTSLTFGDYWFVRSINSWEQMENE